MRSLFPGVCTNSSHRSPLVSSWRRWVCVCCIEEWKVSFSSCCSGLSPFSNLGVHEISRSLGSLASKRPFLSPVPQHAETLVAGALTHLLDHVSQTALWSFFWLYCVPWGERGIGNSTSLLTSICSCASPVSQSLSILSNSHGEKLIHISTYGQQDGTSFEAAVTLPACAVHGKVRIKLQREELILGSLEQEWSSPASLSHFPDGFQLCRVTSHAKFPKALNLFWTTPWYCCPNFLDLRYTYR